MEWSDGFTLLRSRIVLLKPAKTLSCMGGIESSGEGCSSRVFLDLNVLTT